MKGGMDLVVVKHHRCVENLVVSVGKRRKDEGNGTVDVGGGRVAIVLVSLAVVVVVVVVVVVGIDHLPARHVLRFSQSGFFFFFFFFL